MKRRNIGDSPNLSELKSMTDDEIIHAYDMLAQRTIVGTQYYLDEMRYREALRLNGKVVALTRWITVLTVIITIATILNVVVFLMDSQTMSGGPQ